MAGDSKRIGENEAGGMGEVPMIRDDFDPLDIINQLQTLKLENSEDTSIPTWEIMSDLTRQELEICLSMAVKMASVTYSALVSFTGREPRDVWREYCLELARHRK